MIKKLSTVAIALILASCGTTNKDFAEDNQNGFLIEDQIVDDSGVDGTGYQVIEDENQAQAMSEDTQILDETPIEDANAKIEEVVVKDRVFFGYDSAKIDNDAAEILNVQADWLKNNPDIKIIIEGHCDEKGTREYNIALGEKRAIAAKNYLVKKGVDASRIKTVSYGKERPAFFGISLDIFAKNRRAVVVAQ